MLHARMLAPRAKRDVERVLGGGIAEALITTAAGLTVAIPALLGYKYLRGRVDTLVVQMEKESIKLVQAMESRPDL